MSHLEPEVVLCLVRHLAVVVADVAFPDQAVDGPLVWVCAVPQRPAVVQAELVLRRRREAAGGGEGDEKGMRKRGKVCAWQCFPEGAAASPSVVAVHVFLEPVLEVAQLVLHRVHHLHGRVQVAAAQAVVDDGPHRVALDLAVL